MTEQQVPYVPTTTGAPVRVVLSDDDREFWLKVRESLLALVDAVERKIHTSPRTAELRRQAKQG